MAWRRSSGLSSSVFEGADDPQPHEPEPQLPPEVVRQGITVKKVSPDLLGVVALSSSDPRQDTVFLSNFAILRIVDNIKRLIWQFNEMSPIHGSKVSSATFSAYGVHSWS